MIDLELYLVYRKGDYSLYVRMTHLRYISVILGSVDGSLFMMGVGAVTFAIRLRNGPNGAVHSSKTILEEIIIKFNSKCSMKFVLVLKILLLN